MYPFTSPSIEEHATYDTVEGNFERKTRSYANMMIGVRLLSLPFFVSCFHIPGRIRGEKDEGQGREVAGAIEDGKTV